MIITIIMIMIIIMIIMIIIIIIIVNTYLSDTLYVLPQSFGLL